MRSFFALFLICLAVLSCSTDKYEYTGYDSYRRYYDEGYGTGDGGMRSGWSESLIQEYAAACVDGALGGQTNYPELERDAKKFCPCAFEVISQNYRLSTFQYSGDTVFTALGSSGAFSQCF